MDFMELLNNFAFPVVSCIALAYILLQVFVRFMQALKEKDEQIKTITETHSKESGEFTSALNRNTVVLERLCVMLGDKEGTVHDQSAS